MIARTSITKIALLFFASMAFINTEAQIGIGVNPPHSSAALQIQDTAKGLLIPRMTAAHKNAIVAPADGLMLYQTDGDKGFWFFNNGQWRNVNGGKNTLYLSDDITNAEAAAKIAAEAGSNTEIVRIVRCTKLTSVDLSILTSLQEVYIYGDSLLQTVNLGNLQYIDAGLLIEHCPKITNFQVPQLKRVGPTLTSTYAIWMTNNGLTSLSFPQLTKVTGTVQITDLPLLTSVSAPLLTEHVLARSYGNTAWPFIIQNNPLLTSISFPSLVSAGEIGIAANVKLNSVNFNSLTTALSLSINGGNLVSSLSFPALTNVPKGLSFNSNTQLTTISLPVLTTAANSVTNGGYLNFGLNPLLTAINLPQLTTTENLNITGNTALSSLNVPLLATAGTFNIINSPQLTSVTFPSLTKLGGFNGSYVTGCTNVVSVTLPVLNIFLNGGFGVTQCSLPSSEVNYLLNKFVSLTPPISWRAFDFRQAVPAPPTGQGITDKATLISRNNTVSTD